MSKGMLGMLPLSAARGPVAGLFDNLASENGSQYLDELKRFNRREPCWDHESMPLFVDAGMHVTTGIGDSFVVSRHFGNEAPKKGEVDFGYACLNHHFTEHFLPLTEVGLFGRKIKIRRLAKNSLSMPIMHALGVPWIELAHIFELLKKQPHGERGPLTTDGLNLCFVKGIHNYPWIVSFHFRIGSGWKVYAHPIWTSDGWHKDTCVIVADLSH